jgi:hypothetical protein
MCYLVREQGREGISHLHVLLCPAPKKQKVDREPLKPCRLAASETLAL